MTARSSVAILSSHGDLTSFSFDGRRIRFKTPKRLERYLDVREWDSGYLAVTARYHGLPDTEEYIDLVPILKNLYIDPDSFLSSIETVEVSYA
ncbi:MULTISPECIES: DUF7724 family protein [unclassified Adlercreutzia]|uniref:DUF7724 family protein n=1 Tax=unclassified Adlercreutzia TaxID=2636013 RepID=UPI0013EA96A3|nr:MULTISPECIES: hypothetical protein [unclassified Adlercreutzia]